MTVPSLASDILAVSLDGPGSPSIRINLAKRDGENQPYGWGFGWYPVDRQAAMMAKDPAARGTQVLMDAITDWSDFRSATFFCKVRGANKGYSHTETQPFSRSFAGCDWMFMHNGHLDKAGLSALPGSSSRFLEPLGGTDSEMAFCRLLGMMQESGARRLADVDSALLHSWFLAFDPLGSADMFLSDGASVVCFHGTQSPKEIYYGRVQPPNNQAEYVSDAASVSLRDPRDSYRTALIVSTSRFDHGEWTAMDPGEMLVVRRGKVVWNSISAPYEPPPPPPPPTPAKPNDSVKKHEQGVPPLAHFWITKARRHAKAPEEESLPYRTLDVTHVTRYAYAEKVEHSTHVFRLQPIDDPLQEVTNAALAVSSAGEMIPFEDVFGNPSVHYSINAPYKELTVESRSRVKLFAQQPDDFSLSRRRLSLPLIWMPWQRQMMTPYLLPPELPESQLMELTDYAMSFAERNDHHLLQTLEDINLSIYRDYRYVPGATSVNTTPFEVYATRKGVCQDFANLFICLTRLLSIPSRYRMGYIYTGVNYENKIQSDASHAWAETYLPYVGWRGFDPTNGCMAAMDHIRVACGRNYRDATPTSGTIYKGGGRETLSAEVRVEDVIDTEGE